MNAWIGAAIVLVCATAPCVVTCLFGTAEDALVAVELAGVLATSTLLALSEGLRRQPFVDLALACVLTSAVGAISVARLIERTER